MSEEVKIEELVGDNQNISATEVDEVEDTVSVADESFDTTSIESLEVENSNLSNEEVESQSPEVQLSAATEAFDSETLNEDKPMDVEGEATGLIPLLQALFLSSSDPLDLETLAQVCEVDQDCMREALNLLTAMLESDRYGFSLVAVAKGFQLRTKAQFGRYIRALRQESPRKLSPAALETLAVIAYRQPVVKHDIDGLRGVDVMPTLKTLLERGLIQVVGHRETVGHPSLYGTTEEFLKIFGLNSLEDLPTVNELNHMKAEPGEEASSTYENPLASLVENDLEHVTTNSI